MKNRKLFFIVFLMLVSLFFASCMKDHDNENADNNNTSMEFLPVDPNFDWSTAKDIDIKIFSKDNQGNPLPNAIVKVYTDFPDDGGLLMLTGVTDANGLFKSTRPIPSYMQEIVLATEQIGLVNFAKVPVVNNTANFTFGGKFEHQKSTVSLMPKSTNSVYNFLGTYNNQGVPDYLNPDNDIISAEFLQDINNSLPEQQDLMISHPEYLSVDFEHDLLLDCGATVWVTFIHEGASYKNVLGFYTYNLSSPPTSPNEIDTITIIFPNVSYQGSGGGLQSGNKVNIGTFPDSTGIGWVLISDGWISGQVTNGRDIFYSDRNFNPEAVQEDKQHSVLLNDPSREKLILGFEDILRDGTVWCDHDFNDAIFFVAVDPVPCTILDIPIIDYVGVDSDGDGIPDAYDDYPDDPEYSFDNHYPCIVEFGTLAFEDLWPGTGDYDFNDLVINYQFNQITNNNNDIVHINGKFVILATGAGYLNGFGFQLPIPSNEVSSVSGYDIRDGYVNLDPGNNLEANQANATIIVYDNSFNILPYQGGGIGVNTVVGAPYIIPQDTIEISIDLASNYTYDDLGSPPYNPFLIADENRGYEIHLPDYIPSDLLDNDLFGTMADDSKPVEDRYFRTTTNLPWAINIFSEFDYPIEKAQISQAYLKFSEWAESNGTIYQDWYKDLPGYRNNDYIYASPQ